MMKRKNLEWRDCSEYELPGRLGEAGEMFGPGVLCVLEGELGAGKSAFAREVIRIHCPRALSRGSPTFPLVQEYRADAGFPVFHIDLYRLQSEDEFLDSGIAEQIDSGEALVLVEWASLFPEYFERSLSLGSRRAWVRVRILPGSAADTRTYLIETVVP
jgi:tRNA threonylcarbamoyl adenosine modification protein YjeE